MLWPFHTILLNIVSSGKPAFKMALSWNVRSAYWGCVSALLAAIACHTFLYFESHFALRFVTGIGVILLVISSLISFHISTLRCSPSHTLRSLLLSYVLNTWERFNAASLMSRITYMCRHPKETQEALLRELIRRQAKTEYGRDYRLDEIRSLEELRTKHPLAEYGHFKEYIQRLVDGEDGVFLNEQPLRFGVTSGTTGVGKIIPLVPFYFAGDRVGVRLKNLPVFQSLGWPSPLQKRCFLYTRSTKSLTKTGKVISSYTYITEKDIARLAIHSSPPPTFEISDEPTTTYIHMLFAIADPNLAVLGAMFSTQVHRALKCLETNWPAMLKDLSTGRIDAKLLLTPDQRRSIQSYLRQDPARVLQLRKEFEKGFDGIARRLWPQLIVVLGIDVVGYWKILQETHTRGVPCVSHIYGGTEGGITGINMKLEKTRPSYTLLPHSAVFEFIPEEESSKKDPKCLFIDEVEIGGKYELVMTTRSGLYRYRNGDIIQIVDFYENSPVIRMLHRTSETLSLVSEKLTSSVMADALDLAVKDEPGLQLVDWTCAENSLFGTDGGELSYVIFIEVDGRNPVGLATELKSKIDYHLQQSHYTYRYLRKLRTVSEPRVYLVQTGTFAELRNVTVANTTASPNQYKTPRKLKTKEMGKWMMERAYPADSDVNIPLQFENK